MFMNSQEGEMTERLVHVHGPYDGHGMYCLETTLPDGSLIGWCQISDIVLMRQASAWTSGANWARRNARILTEESILDSNPYERAYNNTKARPIMEVINSLGQNLLSARFAEFARLVENGTLLLLPDGTVKNIGTYPDEEEEEV
jgi:hypothetical protein